MGWMALAAPMSVAQVAVPPADSSVVAPPDSLAPLPVPVAGPRHVWAPTLVQRKRSPLAQIRTTEDRMVVVRDSTGAFLLRRTAYGQPLGVAYTLPFEVFAARNLERASYENWEKLVQEARRRNESRRGLLDFRINIPGGQRSAFTTIFGKPEVNLRVTGQANMNIGASIQETADPSVPPDQQKRVDPTFDQNLKLNIAGTIGDKLTIRTDWDTERSFNYQNRLSIVYTGYEDEIIQSIELGNVSMETGNSLVRGGGALFGIKSRARLGALELTGILSQQEGKGSSQTISGGATTVPIDIRPNGYDADRHFFADFYARQEFEGNMADPTFIRRLFTILSLDVWVLNETLAPNPNQRTAVALLDLGTRESGGFYAAPNQAFDPFQDADFDPFRDPSTGVSATDFGVEPDEFAEGFFIPLTQGVDYEFDENLGILSLRTRLNPRQALAIAFSYQDANGNIVYVGDRNLGDNQRLFLKLLRPSSYTPNSRSWPLTLRNVYSLGASNLTADGLQLDIIFAQGNQEQTNLPGLSNILLRDLGLDRVGSQGQVGADNTVDFGTGTLNPRDGRILFPYLEPFGQRIIDIINASSLSVEDKQAAITQYAFPELYTETQSNASLNSRNSLYRLKGTSKGGLSESYFLGIALVEGSVRVTANGRELTEGIDYEVDYSLGSILITNRSYLAPGQEIRIEYESNNVFQIQQTTFMGLRAQYNVSPDITLGSTIFRQQDRPLQDKIPIGEEPVNNTVIGFDAKARFDTPWLTRAIDRVPLLQTRAPSSFSFTGEFAQIRPGVAQTNAVSAASDRGILYGDEERGVSFIDEFEGSKTSISFLSPGRWHLAAPPFALPGFDADPATADQSVPSRLARADRRAQFSWYTVPISLSAITGAARTVESLPIQVTDVFPDRDVLRQDNILQTLDVWFDPTTRGPYNFNDDLKNLLEQRPDETWGGMTAVIPSGLDDLTQNNIEFLEFWVQAILPDGREPTAADVPAYDGRLLFDIGVVSEDVVPNNLNNSEDGIAERSNNLKVDQFGRSYVYNNLPNIDGQFSQETINLEDAGLDAAVNTGGIDGTGEDVLYAAWLARMATEYAGDTDMLSRLQADPAGDDYMYFDDPRMADLPLHARFHRMFPYSEGNALTTGGSRAITNRPDTEGLLNPAVVNLENSFYQFEVPFNPADTTRLSIGENYIVDKVDGGEQWNTWYQVRVPLRDFLRAVGSIQNLQRVSHLRMWMTGYRQPFTLRFATLELVGNQWRKADEVSAVNAPNTVFEVSTINIEENSNRRPVPYRIPNGAIRSIQRGGQQETLANEQSLVLRVEDLPAGDLRLIRRVYPMGMNLTNYSNMRMFVHGEGYRDREDLELVVRLGSDLVNNYYEYRQPITPTDTLYPFGNSRDNAATVLESDVVWLPDENGMNLIVGALNALKQLRNLEGADPGASFERPASAVQRNAPAGTVLAIKGEPTLNRVIEIGIGIRNPGNAPSLNGEIWVNELRVSGFNDESGWSANMRSQLVFADFATVSASFNRSTDGFGGLDSRIGDRQQFERIGFDLNTTVNLHKFIPDRFGWNIPLSLSARQTLQTPRFLPRQGDVTFADFEAAVNASDTTAAAKRDIIARQLREIQDFQESYSFNLTNISKQYSQSRLGRLLMDNTRLSYVYNTAASRNYLVSRNDNWNYTASVNYQLNVRQVRTVKPFWWLEEVPVARLLSGAEFAYQPSSITASATLNRNFAENERRAWQNSPALLTQTHAFRYSNTFGFSYNVMPPITIAFSSSTQNDLTLVGQDSIPGADRIRLVDSWSVLRNAVGSDSLRPRRNEYQESYNLSWRPRLNRIPGLNWFTYTAGYRGGFAWRNTPLGSGRGANLANQYTLDNNPGIRVQELLRKWDWYDAQVKADESARRERDTARNRLRQQRERERAARNQPEAQTQPTQPAGRGGTPTPPAQAGAQAQVQVPKKTFSEHLTYWTRRTALSLVSFQNLDVTWQHTVSSSQQGYRGGSSLWSSFNDESDNRFSPGLGYRIGLSDRIPTSQLIRSSDPAFTIPLAKSRTTQDNLTLRSAMQPVRDITVNLDWSAIWDNRTNLTQSVGTDEIRSQRAESGNVNATVWAFGKGYGDFFRRQLQTVFDDLDPASGSIVSDGTGNADGRTALNANTLQEDFRKSYLGGAGKTIGARGFMAVPLPNWRISWAGLEKYLPGWAADHVQRVTLTHTYVGKYRLGWVYNVDAGAPQVRQVGSYRIEDERMEYQPNTVNIERSFDPLVGMQIGWKNGITSDIQYKSARLTGLSLSNSTITEKVSRGLRVTGRYSKRGFRLPFMKRLQNTFEASLSISYIEDETYTYQLITDLQSVLGVPQNQLPSLNAADYSPAKVQPRGDVRIQISPLIGYQFSQTVRANFEYRYERLIPRSSGVFPRTTQDIRFNIIVSIRS